MVFVRPLIQVACCQPIALIWGLGPHILWVRMVFVCPSIDWLDLHTHGWGLMSSPPLDVVTYTVVSFFCLISVLVPISLRDFVLLTTC
jgi:hypothetical protein